MILLDPHSGETRIRTEPGFAQSDTWESTVANTKVSPG